MGHVVFHTGINLCAGLALRVGAHCLDYCAYSVASGRNLRLWLKSGRLTHLVCHTGGGKPPNRLVKPARFIVGLLLERSGARVGLEGYLLRYDAVYGHPVNRLAINHILPTNCFVAA